MSEPTRANRAGDSQPLPTSDNLDFPSMHDLIATEMASTMEARKAIGIERYGQALRPFNGRDAHVDAWEEMADLAVYMRQARFEAEEMRSIITTLLGNPFVAQNVSMVLLDRMKRAVRINIR